MGGLLVDLSPGVLIWGPFWVSVWGLGVEGCRFGGPFEAGVLICGPFWVSVWGLGVEGCWQQLKISKIAPLCSARPVLTKRFPQSALVVRRDLRVFPYPKSQQNTRITTDSLSPGVQAENSNSQSARYLQHVAWPAAVKKRES